MTFQPRLAATLCAVLMCSPVFAGAIDLPTSLDNLLPDGDFAIVGDLTFDQFTYSANGDMPIAEQILVEPQGAGLRFTGPFIDLPGGVGNEASLATLGFTVTGNISEVTLAGNPSLLGGSGNASVVETFAGFPTLKLDIHDNKASGDLPFIRETSVGLGTTVSSLTVVKAILLVTDDPVSSATLSIIDQQFIPEPASFGLLLAGFAGIVVLRRRR